MAKEEQAGKLRKKKYLSKQKRQAGGVRFLLTERDIEILKMVSRYRYVRAGQVKQLLFNENKTLQNTRRRLKYLFHNGYLGRIAPFIQI